MKDLKIKVEFGVNGNGTISVSSGIGKLTLKEIADNVSKKIGDNLIEGEWKELPSIELNFYDSKSIDIVILHLQQAKRLMSEGLYLAC